MKEYKVNSKDTKSFYLSQDGLEIGSLIYEKWFSFKAEMILQKKDTFQIEPKGFWGTTIELKQHDKVLLNFKLNWNGNIIISTQFDSNEKGYVFKQKGILKTTFVLLDTNEAELLSIQPDFKWSKLYYDYNISTSAIFESLNHNDILLLTAIHCINYYMSMMTTSAVL